MTSKKQRTAIKYQVRETIRPTVAPLTTAIGGALAAGTLQAATITVTSLDGGFVSGECTLRSALYAASTNSTFGTCPSGDAGEDIIEFDSALEGTIYLEAAQGADLYYDGSTLPIGEDLRIYGDDRITINGSGNAPVFYGKYQADGLQAEAIRFNDLTITGGGGDYGAGILARNRVITLFRSVVEGNNASVSGGAIWQQWDGADTGLINIAASEISGNQSSDTGGGGGAIFTSSRDAVIKIISNSVISGNTSLGSGGAVEWKPSDDYASARIECSTSQIQNNLAKYGNGGAINARTEAYGAVRMTLDRCGLSGNESSANGGAIAVRDQLGLNAEISVLPDVVFDNNSAGGDGGAIWIDRTAVSAYSFGTASIRFGPSDSLQSRVTFSNNVAASSGGAVYIAANDEAAVNFEAVDFIGNEALDGDGGAAYVRSGSDGLTLADVAFEANLALDGDGGGLQATSISGDVLGTDVRFLYNAAAGAGGARVFSTDGDIGFERSVFRDNTAVDFYGGGLQIEGNPAQVGIGRSIVSGNSANFGGGGLDLFISPRSAALQIKYSEFSGNTTNGPGGGALISAGENRQMYLSNITLSDNSGSLGGAMRVDGNMELQIKYSTIADNYATTGTGGLLTLLPNGCDINNSLLAGSTTGPENDPEDLRGINDLCNVSHSLVSGNDSDFNDVTGNVLYQDPRMDTLADNGGSGGRTHALWADSPALDAGDAAATAPSTDQRGSPFVRIFGSEVDMGAYERQEFLDAIFSDRFEAP